MQQNILGVSLWMDKDSCSLLWMLYFYTLDLNKSIIRTGQDKRVRREFEFVKRRRLSISSLSCVMLGDLEVKRNGRHSRPLTPPAPGCPHSHCQLHNHKSNNIHAHANTNALILNTVLNVLSMCSFTIYLSIFSQDCHLYVWRSLCALKSEVA